MVNKGVLSQSKSEDNAGCNKGRGTNVSKEDITKSTNRRLSTPKAEIGFVNLVLPIPVF